VAIRIVHWKRSQRSGSRGKGYLHIDGQGVPTNYVEAYKWLDLAVRKGRSDAKKLRDAVYSELNSDQRAAAEKLVTDWRPVTLASEEIDQTFKDGLYAFDRGDFTTALGLLRSSANQGHGEAQSFLGIMYFNGKGVQKDYIQAYKWLDIADRHGNADGSKFRNVIVKVMSASQIAEAEELVKIWRSSR
jgi:uncharacterized protein